MIKLSKFTLPLLAFVAIFVGVVGVINAQPVAADGFDAGRIMDDGVFTDASSMNANDIQQFLNSKVPVCDTYGTQISEFGGGTRAQWGQANYGQSTFTCLKDYSENGRSSAQIIYDTAQTYGINPKVLLVLLQKEESLVTDTWPLNIQYRSATGYGCPDTSVCDSQYYGLTNQITWSAKMFRAIINDSPTWYTPYILGNNYIQYNPDASCGGSTVNIVNRATQALYNYTPYQPNAATIAAGWGTAPCGAYGNRNFYLYYTSWFGSTTEAPSYGYSIVSQDIYSDANYQTEISNPVTTEPNSDFYVKLVIKNTGNQVWQNDTLRIGGDNPKDRSSIFGNSDWVNAGRPAAMIEPSVAGGGTATFKFRMHAPAYLGYYPESFGVLIEGSRWLDGTFTLPVTVASANPYYMPQIISFEAYADSARTRKLNPLSIANYTGSKVYMKVIVKNRGNQTLPANTTQVATANPLDHPSIFSDGSWLVPSQSRAAKAQEGDILPQGTGTFLFTLTSPSTPVAKTTEQFGLVIDGVAWLNTNIGQVSIQSSQRPPQVLNPNDVLNLGQSLVSSDDKYHLDLQGDGNLVLYSPYRALWASWTVGTGATKLVMQSDGNIVLYDANWKPVWDTHTGGRGASKLLLQPDGNIVDYSLSNEAYWNTVTGGLQ